jgi:hypothetical protein
MVKKLIDISSPKVSKEKKEVFEKSELLVISREPEKPKEIKPKAKKKFPLKSIIFLAIVFLLITGVLISFKFSRAEIKIWPELEDVSFVETIILDVNAQNLNLEKKIIPGKVFETEESFSDSFNSSGKILKKSEGIIRLFNEYTTQEEVWKEGTRFVSSDGKLFKSKDKIIVPGAKIKNGKMEPSFVDVPVVAAEGGEAYNIGPSDFSVVAFKGSPRYFKYYGKSFQPMKGGGEFPQVTKEDLEKAEKQLIEKASEKSKEILEQKIGKDFTFSSDILEISILEKNSSTKEGEEKEKFDFQIKVKIKTIIFSKEILSKFAQNYLISKISAEKEIYPQSIDVDLKGEVKNFELGKANLQAKISGKVYLKLDQLALKKSIAGKSLNETRILLTNQKGILRTKIEIFPFWIQKIPENINKIEVSYPNID